METKENPLQWVSMSKLRNSNLHIIDSWLTLVVGVTLHVLGSGSQWRGRGLSFTPSSIPPAVATSGTATTTFPRGNPALVTWFLPLSVTWIIYLLHFRNVFLFLLLFVWFIVHFLWSYFANFLLQIFTFFLLLYGHVSPLKSVKSPGSRCVLFITEAKV